MDKLFDEDLLLGRGWTTHESLRPLAYSTLADLVHHVRQHLTINVLAKAVHLFSKNVHDESLPTSIQVSPVAYHLTLPHGILIDCVCISTDNVLQIASEFGRLYSATKRCGVTDGPRPADHNAACVYIEIPYNCKDSTAIDYVEMVSDKFAHLSSGNELIFVHVYFFYRKTMKIDANTPSQEARDPLAMVHHILSLLIA